MFFFYLSIFFVHEYTRLFSPEVIAESIRIEVKYRYIFSFKFGIEKFLQVEIFVFDWLKVLLPVKSLQNKWNSYKKIIRSALILYQHSINILFPRVIFRKYWWYILYIFSIYALLSVYNKKHNDVTIVIVWLKPYLETIKSVLFHTLKSRNFLDE